MLSQQPTSTGAADTLHTMPAQATACSHTGTAHRLATSLPLPAALAATVTCFCPPSPPCTPKPPSPMPHSTCFRQQTPAQPAACCLTPCCLLPATCQPRMQAALERGLVLDDRTIQQLIEEKDSMVAGQTGGWWMDAVVPSCVPRSVQFNCPLSARHAALCSGSILLNATTRILLASATPALGALCSRGAALARGAAALCAGPQLLHPW